jgi:hypothetical protein
LPVAVSSSEALSPQRSGIRVPLSRLGAPALPQHGERAKSLPLPHLVQLDDRWLSASDRV